MFINVCAAATNECANPRSAACIKNKHDQNIEQIGSFAFYDIGFHAKSELVKHDYIELTYQIQNSRCKLPNIFAVTTIRFLCPSDLGLENSMSRRQPFLVSELQCRYQIDWITDYACAQPQIMKEAKEKDCSFQGVDFSQFNQTKYWQVNADNATFYLNVCGDVDSAGCSKSSVCIANNSLVSSISNRQNAHFIKADNTLSLVQTSKNPQCQGNQLYTTVIEFVCDPQVIGLGTPKFVAREECTFTFLWATSRVCPLVTKQLDCTSQSEDGHLQFDLSSLVRPAPYTVQKFVHDPKYYYILSPDQKLSINICGEVPVSKGMEACSGAGACLYNTKAPEGTSGAISLGRFVQRPIFNAETKNVELVSATVVFNIESSSFVLDHTALHRRLRSSCQ